ncbi:hypothetical protein GAS19_26580 [Burkholderia glumae]|nr:hypothetical protein GAS19_26580 [Burkholderia glumae]
MRRGARAIVAGRPPAGAARPARRPRPPASAAAPLLRRLRRYRAIRFFSLPNANENNYHL